MRHWIICTSLENLWPVIRSSLFESAVEKEFEQHDSRWYICKLSQRPTDRSIRPEKNAVNVIGTKLFVTNQTWGGGHLSYVALWPAARTWWHHSIGLFSHRAVKLEGLRRGGEYPKVFLQSGNVLWVCGGVLALGGGREAGKIPLYSHG